MQFFVQTKDSALIEYSETCKIRRSEYPEMCKIRRSGELKTCKIRHSSLFFVIFVRPENNMTKFWKWGR